MGTLVKRNPNYADTLYQANTKPGSEIYALYSLCKEPQFNGHLY